MAEQWIKAFAVDERALVAIVGSRDPSLVERATAEMEDLLSQLQMTPARRADRAADLEAAIAEVVAGALSPDHDRRYRDTIEIFLTVVGEELGEVVLPGRRWNRLRGWAAAGLGALEGIWGTTQAPFPWRELPSSRAELEGAVALRLHGSELRALHDQLVSRHDEAALRNLVRSRDQPWEEESGETDPDEEEEDEQEPDADDLADDVDELSRLLECLRTWRHT